MHDAAVCICQHINHMRQPVHSGYIHTSMVCPWVVLSLARNAAKVARPFPLDHNTTAVMLAILASLHGILWHCNSLCSCTYVHMHVSTYVYIPISIYHPHVHIVHAQCVRQGITSLYYTNDSMHICSNTSCYNVNGKRLSSSQSDNG